MDKIKIINLEVFGNHGVFPEETRLGQKFLVSLTLYVDTRIAGTSDDLSHSVNYGEISHFITDFMRNNTFKLIESVAEQLAKAILLEYCLVKKVKLSIDKPWAPIGLPLESVKVVIERGWHTAYLSLGSNMGDKEAYIAKGMEQLRRTTGCYVKKVSKLITTPPYGGVAQDEFLNGCLQLETLLTPYELLDRLHEIEADANRERLVHWGPRTLDLDILFYDNEIIVEEDLIIPHVDLHNRRFVLEPLSELAPYYVHPLKKKTIKELLDELHII